MRLQGFLYTIAAACRTWTWSRSDKTDGWSRRPTSHLCAYLCCLVDFYSPVSFGKATITLPALSRSAWVNILLLAGLGTRCPSSYSFLDWPVRVQSPEDFCYNCKDQRVSSLPVSCCEKTHLEAGSWHATINDRKYNRHPGRGTGIISWQTGIWGERSFLSVHLASDIPSFRPNKSPSRSGHCRLVRCVCFWCLVCYAIHFYSVTTQSITFSWFIAGYSYSIVSPILVWDISRSKRD